ncbi:hypothetical protein Esti_000297 [Eimeria stiedai]
MTTVDPKQGLPSLSLLLEFGGTVLSAAEIVGGRHLLKLRMAICREMTQVLSQGSSATGSSTLAGPSSRRCTRVSERQGRHSVAESKCVNDVTRASNGGQTLAARKRRRKAEQAASSERTTVDGCNTSGENSEKAASVLFPKEAHPGALKNESPHRVLTIPLPEGFDFSMAICSYGFFCMMPNQWIPPVPSKMNGEDSMKRHGKFRRPLRYGDGATRCCVAELTCEDPSCLRVTLTGELPENGPEESEILKQINRMCRLDASAFQGHSIEQFWRLHPEAKNRKFGYLFRSPTLWEDMVKTITICNVRWKQSLVMNRQLCNVASSVPGSFPSPWDVARFSPEDLQKRCSLGYRGERVRRLADSFISGSLNFDLNTVQRSLTTTIEIPTPNPMLPSLAEATTPPTKRRRTKGSAATSEESTKRNEVLKKLLSIYGFGRFAAENVMQLMGFFDVDVFDSETARFMREAHGVTNKDVSSVWKAARRHFEQYRPFQFLAYWFELWKLYEASVGTQSLNWTAENAYFVDGSKRL